MRTAATSSTAPASKPVRRSVPRPRRRSRRWRRRRAPGSPSEADDRRNVFDIALLADRLLAATRWLRARPETTDLPLGYFGARTGAAAALRAPAEPDCRVGAVVSPGGERGLAVVPGATHLFEEPGALERVPGLASA